MYKSTYSKDQIGDIVEKLKELLAQCHVMTFTGSLGAGKTTLISNLVRSLGTKDQVNSPTFTYVNIYTLPDGKKIYHFDLYRIETIDQFIEAGFDEYLHVPNSWVLIEWPAVIEPLLRHDVCRVVIDQDVNKADVRTISMTCRD